MLQFAYATNMNVKNLTDHLSSAKKIANAYLPGYELVCNHSATDLSSKANIMPVDNPDVPVWGILVEFDEADSIALDSGGWPETMEPKMLNCVDEGGNLYQARVFVALPHAVNEYLLPYDWYMEKLVTLAEMNSLPDTYINKLRTIPTKPDIDVKRKERRLKNFREGL